jgi:Raf kinase inhibitor-like YbhB/YbcL family protein
MRISLGVAAALVGLVTGARAFELNSPDLPAGQRIPEMFVYTGFGCSGQNLSPALTWTDPPEGTRSFALMVHDPDAPTGGAGIWHWVVINIPATVRELPRGAGTQDGMNLPTGARQIITDYDVPGWGGPCPPKGAPAHSYNFTLYALKVDTLSPPPAATASHVGFLINMNALGNAKLTATYGR